MTSERSPQEVGEILRARREMVGFVQTNVPDVSAATVGKIERGAAERFRSRSLTSYLRALGLPPDAYERIAAGEDIASMLVSWSTGDPVSSLDRLRVEDPDAWADLERMARRILGGAA